MTIFHFFSFQKPCFYLVKNLQGNLIQMYKVLNNLEEINWYKGTNLATNPHEKRSTSGNQQSLVREHFPLK